MPFAQSFKIKKTALAMTALLYGTASAVYAAPAHFSSQNQLLTIDAVDIQSGNAVSSTYSATLKLVGADPFKFELEGANVIKQPGGNRAVFDPSFNKVTIPGVNLDGTHDFYVEMDLIPGSNPLAFNVTKLEDITGNSVFNRIASFPVYMNTDVETETVAEIVDVSKDGNMLIYTDGAGSKIGFVDIKNPADPKPLGTVNVSGEPTSVAVAGDYALAAVNTSPSFTDPSGELHVIDIAGKTTVAKHSLGGQPDAAAVSPDGQYAAIVIENERDEDLGEGEPPQAPAGFLVIVDLKGSPDQWALRNVSFDGVVDLFPNDPEPEYVDINEDNMAVVTFQENNHIALVDLKTGTVTKDFSAGTTNLTQIDTEEEDPALISLTESLSDLPREPDGISWLTSDLFATADEGDLFGGSRGFTVFDSTGSIVFDTGNTLEHEAVRLGHYPDGRSGNKGNEPENVDFGQFGDDSYVFIASERSSIVFVYRMNDGKFEWVQTLPAGVGPEGIKTIPERNLVIAASENDDRGDKMRSLLTIYQLQSGGANYPTIESTDRTDGTPIPWGALSGLAAGGENKAYTIPDSFYQQSRIFSLDLSKDPAVIDDEIVLKDDKDLLAAIAANQVNEDKTVNLDLEGISMSAAGGFWLASEGRGTVGDESRPVETQDLLIHATNSGMIDKVAMLPNTTNNRQVRFGFEGVAAVGSADSETLFVAFQREWHDDPDDQVRIGRYETATGNWSFYYYPLDAAQSPNGGWVGLSEITALGNDEFAVIERDNQGNTDARIKRIYRFSVAGLTPLADAAEGETPTFPLVNKILVRDLIPDLEATGGMVLEKIESFAVTGDGEGLIINDNDGVDDSNGETQLIRIKNILN